MRRVLRASGKAVWTWPPVGATDAGPMQIQLKEGAALGRGETVLQGTTHDTVHAENWLRRKSIARTVVEEAGRRDRLKDKAQRYEARRRTRITNQGKWTARSQFPFGNTSEEPRKFQRSS